MKLPVAPALFRLTIALFDNRCYGEVWSGMVIDPEVGDPDGGIAPGTAFEDIPDDWTCPDCGVGKKDFDPYEEEE